MGDPVFIKLHQSQVNYHHPRFIFLNSQLRYKLHSEFSIIKCEGLEHQDNSLKAQDIHLDLPNKRFQIIGSSNGLMCLSRPPINKSIYVVNPVTRETLKLKRSLEFSKMSESSLCGFAYDNIANTYKVFRTWTKKKQPRTRLEIYTLGTCKWRRKKDIHIHFSAPWISSQVLLNGALHWLPCHNGDRREMQTLIVALDINSEKCRTFEVPPPDNWLEYRGLSLLGDALSVTDYYMGNIELWVMKKYGLKESWCREYVLRRDMFRALQNVSINIFRIMKINGSVLLYGDQGDVYYFDLEKETLKDVWIDGLSQLPLLVDAEVHEESLISPKSIEIKGVKNS
ncbi:hypothetical protein AQUCO_01300671v1 [Aquilegia coerulea]|uniref:F-box associated beta-propeller type 3 domain-containing protein n=1 Tax=Aquilegia coerulea TaxID=218851 RepID=A0A2G5E2T7_AQUCA|nr:hypothetical protein AQUCO_01300671v1 [Aquilegia coerulea]